MTKSYPTKDQAFLKVAQTLLRTMPQPKQAKKKAAKKAADKRKSKRLDRLRSRWNATVIHAIQSSV